MSVKTDASVADLPDHKGRNMYSERTPGYQMKAFLNETSMKVVGGPYIGFCPNYLYVIVFTHAVNLE